MFVQFEIKNYDELKAITGMLLNRIIQEHRPAITEESIYWVINELEKGLPQMNIEPIEPSEFFKYNQKDIVIVATQMMKDQFYQAYGRYM